MTIKEFQNRIAALVGEIPEIGRADCFPVAESDGEMIQKINTAIATLGLSCLVMTPDLDPSVDSEMVVVNRLIIGFTETPLTNRDRHSFVTALEAACLTLSMFRKDYADTFHPIRITQRATEDGSVITADLELETSFELTTVNEGIPRDENTVD